MVDTLNRLFGRFSNWRASRDLPTVAEQTEGQVRAASSFAPPGWAWVTVRDEQNELVREGWEYQQPGEHDVHGLADLPGYVERLAKTEAYYSSLIISWDEDEHAVLLMKMDGEMGLTTSFEGPLRTAREREVRGFFQSRAMPVSQDCLVGYPTRTVAWSLPKDAHAAEGVVREYLKKYCGVTEASPLSYTFETQLQNEEDRDESGGCSFVYTWPVEDPNAPSPATGEKVT